MLPLLVADSFRVRVSGGRAAARGFAHHLERFRETVAAAGSPDPASVAAFLRTSRARITEFGAGHPRLEFTGDGELRLTLRPLPDLQTTIELVSAEVPGLVHPERKGPNIPRFAELNRAHGAETLVIGRRPGDLQHAVVEGATTAILWWEDETLCVSAAAPRVRSVTERLILDIARRKGIVAHARAIDPIALARHEVWAVNALHGIRPVTRIDQHELQHADTARLAVFRAALDQTWEPIAGTPPV